MKLFTLRELSTLTGLSKSELNRRCNGGKIPEAYQLENNQWVIPQSAAITYFEELKESDIQKWGEILESLKSVSEEESTLKVNINAR